MILLAGALVVSAVISAGAGTVPIPARDVVLAIWGKITGQTLVDDTTSNIIWNLRLPRLFLAMMVGAALAVAGMMKQSLFHNPMADPFIVGSSSGASAGAVLAITLNFHTTLFGLGTMSLFAFAGSLVVTLLVYFLSRRAGRVQVGVLLLTGIAIGGLMSAMTSFLLIRLDAYEMRGMVAWMMGSFANRKWEHVYVMTPYVVIGLVAAWYWQRDLNILSLGEESAHYLGVDIERTKFFLLALSALLAAAAVSVSGIIAFVGLIVPHIIRLLIGPNHRTLMPGCVLGGALLLVWADFISRRLIPGSELPIGIVTSFIGCFFFLYLLHKRSGRLF